VRSNCVLNIIGKLSVRKGVQALLCGVWTSSMKVIEFGNFYELEKLKNYCLFYFGCGNGTIFLYLRRVCFVCSLR